MAFIDISWQPVKLEVVLIIYKNTKRIAFYFDMSLLEDGKKSVAYSTRCLQLVLQAAKNWAGILKPGSIHALRHSFATRLLEQSTDISYIKKLLAHNDIKTMLIYAQVSKKDIKGVVSPLDKI